MRDLRPRQALQRARRSILCLQAPGVLRGETEGFPAPGPQMNVPRQLKATSASKMKHRMHAQLRATSHETWERL